MLGGAGLVDEDLHSLVFPLYQSDANSRFNLFLTILKFFKNNKFIINLISRLK